MKSLAKQYEQLTPEESFRLILAAGVRSDEVERDRLVQAEQPLTLSMPAHAPYGHAFQELLFLTYIELLEDAALYLESYALADKQLHDSIQSAQTPKRKITTAPRTTNGAREDDMVEFPNWHHSSRTARGVGFLFKIKFEGWKLFCARLNVSPLASWQQLSLPGLDRLEHAVALARTGVSFSSAAEMVCWVNEVRPAGDPERIESDIITAKGYADSLDATFRERVRWWGGCGG